MADEVDPQQLAEQLLAQAKAQGVDLVGPNGQLNQLAEGCASPSRPRRRRRHSALVRASVAGRLADQRTDVRRQDGVPWPVPSVVTYARRCACTVACGRRSRLALGPSGTW